MNKIDKALALQCRLITNEMRGIYPDTLQDFADLVRADERRRITNLMLYMHNKASPYHNYYKHAAVEINRKNGEGEKI